MGRVEARVRSVLRALTCALGVACGSDLDDTASEDEGVQFTSADVSSAGATALEAAQCAYYRDDAPFTDTAITIHNARVSPIYLVSERVQEACQLPALFAVARAGVRLNVHGFAGCAARSCERIQSEGEASLDCADECAEPGLLTRLEAGATIEVGVVDAEYVGHGAETAPMPARCMASDEPTPDAGVACVSKRALPSGLYRVSARAFTSLECDGQRSCECSRTSVGWCLLDRGHHSRDPALEATLEVELPAERVTLVFTEP